MTDDTKLPPHETGDEETDSPSFVQTLMTTTGVFLRWLLPRGRVWYWVLVLTLAFTLLFAARLHHNFVNFGHFLDDESHTIGIGVTSLFPTDPPPFSFRVPEGVRWIVRASYPFALYSMNTTMGGNVFVDGWDYPGHYYIRNACRTGFPDDRDPNVRQFLFSIRLPGLVFFFLSFLPLLYVAFEKEYDVTALGVILAIGMNLDVIREQEFLYVEPVLIASLNLLLAFFLRTIEKRNVSRATVILGAILSSWLVSVKLTCIFFAVLPGLALSWAVRSSSAAAARVAIQWLALSFLGYLAISCTMFAAPDRFVHDLFSNFWNYSTGADEAAAVAAGWPHFFRAMNHFSRLIGPVAWFWTLPVLGGIFLGSREERLTLSCLGCLFLASLAGLCQQRIFSNRNYIVFDVPILLCLFVPLDILRRRLGSHASRPAASAFSGLILGVSVVGGMICAGGPAAHVRELLPSALTETRNALDRLSANRPNRPIVLIGASLTDFQPGVQSRVSVLPDAPDPLYSVTLIPYAESMAARWRQNPETIVVVRRIGNNFQLTNRILPRQFKHNLQWGAYFIFHN